jgi:hypothetical protein
MLFDGTIGETVPPSRVSQRDLLIDSAKFSSEGYWAFCRFEGQDVPALRLGFQRGGFNAGTLECGSNPDHLQLHLELMTQEGAILWLPTGKYPAAHVKFDPGSMSISLEHDGRQIFSLQGWPEMEIHFCSEEGDLQADLLFALNTVTTLPDCRLPNSLFGMWESMGEVTGEIRYKQRPVAVQGKVFFDHTRVIPRNHLIVPRHMYVYTTLYFHDGSGLFGYHSVDTEGRFIEDYCFYIYLDSAHNGLFFENVSLGRLVFDSDGIAKAWEITVSNDRSVIGRKRHVARKSCFKILGFTGRATNKARV